MFAVLPTSVNEMIKSLLVESPTCRYSDKEEGTSQLYVIFSNPLSERFLATTFALKVTEVLLNEIVWLGFSILTDSSLGVVSSLLHEETTMPALVAASPLPKMVNVFLRIFLLIF